MNIKHIARKCAAATIILTFAVLGTGCGALNKDSKGLTINQTIPAKSGMLIKLEDKSGFNLDIENMSDDTLMLERKGLANLMITRASIKAIIEPESAVRLVNPSKRGAKVRVKVTNHTAKVVSQIEPIKLDSTAVK